MGELDCQGSFIPTVVAPCLSLIRETEQEEMGLKGLLEGEGTARVGSEPTGWRIWMKFIQGQGFPGGSDGNESACNAGDPGLIPGLGRSPGEGNGYPPLYSCLENSMDRGAQWATDHGVGKSWTRLSN